MSKVKDHSLTEVSSLKNNGKQDPIDQLETREIIFSDQPLTKSQMSQFADNSVRTAKYTLLTWAPKSLLWQFRRAANVYFLIISVLTAMPFSPKQPMSIIGTFAMVLIFTMLKEGYEDYFRHVADKAVNKAKTTVLDRATKQFVVKNWDEIKVGDIVKTKENEPLCSDMLFLASSNPTGLAFVDTMNLDGETNLKEKLCLEQTRNFDRDNKFSKCYGKVACDAPNMTLIKWFCKLQLLDQQDWLSAGMNQLFLRGMILKNTDYAYGVVVYTGHQTKVMLNSKSPPAKVSNLMHKMNSLLYTVFIFQGFVCILFSIGSQVWLKQKENEIGYLELTSSASA